LTADARKLLEAYAALQEKLDDVVEEAYQELKKKMEK
jgi:molybdenum-dependent DNA-binding transcriptional regulator ModE